MDQSICSHSLPADIVSNCKFKLWTDVWQEMDMVYTAVAQQAFRTSFVAISFCLQNSLIFRPVVLTF